MYKRQKQSHWRPDGTYFTTAVTIPGFCIELIAWGGTRATPEQVVNGWAKDVYKRQIMGNLTSIDEVSLTNEITTMVQPIIINLTRLGGTITASAENPPNEGIEKLIDNDINTKLLAFEPSVRVIFEQSIPTVVTKYSITSANDAPDRDPLRWTLEAVSYTHLDVYKRQGMVIIILILK